MASSTASESEERMSTKADNLVNRLWKMTGLSFNMIILSFKGALPPFFAIAIYQDPDWAQIFTTLGYFVAIISTLAMAMQPRVKFMQTVFTMVVFVCLAAALNLLMILCAVSARDSTSNNSGLRQGSSGSIEATPYDSSANAVAAVWLFINIFGTSFFKSRRPQLAGPTLHFNIYSIVASIYAPSFPNMSSGETFTRRLLITFLTGYAIAAAINLLIWPTTSRAQVKRQSLELISTLKECVQSYKDYLDIAYDDLAEATDPSDVEKIIKDFHERSRKASGQFAEIKGELDYAEKEIACGRISSEQLRNLYVGLREVLQPIICLSTFLQDVDKNPHRDEDSTSQPIDDTMSLKNLKKTLKVHSQAIRQFHDSHVRLADTLLLALDHIGIQLGLKVHIKTRSKDAESNQDIHPGSSDFAHYLEQQLQDCRRVCNQLVQTEFNNDSGEEPPRLSEESLENTIHMPAESDEDNSMSVAVYLMFLVDNAGQAILSQVRFADSTVVNGFMRSHRLIFPGFSALGKLMMGAMMDMEQEEPPMMGDNIWIGDIHSHGKDPEHKTPKNLYEQCSNPLRMIPRLLSSSDAAFALRSAVATISIALAGFLAPSRSFFLEQRGIWAVSMTAIAITPQFGASIFKFALRFLSTAVAAGLSLAAAYIADRNLWGITVLLYLQIAGWFLLAARFPSYELGGVVGAVTALVIVGYQVQVDVIGRAQASSNGQVYYPIYLLAPYRLGAVAAGLAAALFWSIFPFPNTSHGSLRKDTAKTLYMLANYHSCIHGTLLSYSRFGIDIDVRPSEKTSFKRLEEARQNLFGDSILMLGSLRDHLSSTKFEPRIGGKFPYDEYEQVIECLSRIFTYLSMVTYSSKAFIRELKQTSMVVQEKMEDFHAGDEQEWLDRFRTSLASDKMTSSDLTNLLYLLATSVDSGRPLPPGFSKSCLLRQSNEDALKIARSRPDTQSSTHPCYAALNINEITSPLIDVEVKRLADLVKGLVGEFSFGLDTMMPEDG